MGRKKNLEFLIDVHRILLTEKAFDTIYNKMKTSVWCPQPLNILLVYFYDFEEF